MEARLVLNRDEFTRGLDQAKADADKFAAREIKAKLTADGTQAKAVIDDLTTRADKLSGKAGTIKVTADATQADTALDKTTAKADALGRKDPVVKATADTAQADTALDRTAQKRDSLGRFVSVKVTADTAGADAALDKTAAKAGALGRRTETVRVRADTSGIDAATAKVAKLAGTLKDAGGPWWLGPALLSLGAIGTTAGVATGAVVGLAGAFTAGAGALAAFGAVAKPVLSGAETAQKAVTAAQSAYHATLAAGVPVAAAQQALTVAGAKAQSAYAIAIAGGAKPATALLTLHKSLATSQAAYSAATNQGTLSAKAYTTEQAAITKAYAGMSPAQVALSRQLGDMAAGWKNLKTAETPVVAGALVPWLQSVTSLTGRLAPVINAVAPVIQGLGTQFDALVTSQAFTQFRDFTAGTGSKVVGAVGGTLIDFIKSAMILLPRFNPLILEMTGGIGGLGPALVTWASSQKTADDITRFMAWFNASGPQVGAFLKSIGGALKALAPGLTAGGAIELKVLTDFFNLVARLPPAFARPIAEVAGALLLLNKLGVISVGVRIVGAAAGWVSKLLSGATVDVAAGAQEAAATGMQAAADTMVTAAAAMQRAADTMIGADALGGGGAGKAAGAAEGEAAAASAGGGEAAAAGAAGGGEAAAAGGTSIAATAAAGLLAAAAGFIAGKGAGAVWNKFGPGGSTPGQVWARTGTEAGAGAATGAAVGSIVPGIGTAVGAVVGGVGGLAAGILANPRASLQGVLDAFTWLRHGTADVFDGIRHDTATAMNDLYGATIGVAIRIGHNIEAQFDSLRHSVANVFDGIRGDIAGAVSGIISWLDGHWKIILVLITGPVGLAALWLVHAWAGIHAGLVTAWDAMASYLAGWWGRAASVVSAGTARVTSVVSAAWGHVASATATGWNATSSFLAGWWGRAVAMVTSGAGAAWRAVSAGWAHAASATQSVWGGIGRWLAGWWSGVTAAFRADVGTVAAVLLGGWHAVDFAARTVFGGLRTFFGSFWAYLRTGFAAAVSGVASIWGRIEGAVKAPVDWVITNVYDALIRRFWNDVAGPVGLPVLPHLAEGGIVPGGYSRADNQLAWLRSGEGVLQPGAVAALGGAAFVNWANRAYGDVPVSASGAGHYAGGGIHVGNPLPAIGHAIGSIAGGVSGFLGGLVNDVKSGIYTAMASAGGAVIGAAARLVPGTTGVADAMRAYPAKLWDGFASWVTGHGPGPAASGSPGGAGSPGVAHWAGVILQALGMLNQPASWLNTVERRMNQESGGNATIVNTTDSNWAAGTPSVGLMQVIGPTFAAYAGPFRNLGPFEYGTSVNPLANVYAGLNYALNRYGSLAALNQPGGYDNGGWLQPGVTMAVNATGRPEAVLTGEQWDALTSAVAGGGTPPLAGTLNVMLPEGTSLTAALNELDYRLHAARMQGFLGG